MTASEWYHSFTPEASNLLFWLTIVIIVVGYLSGRASVKVLPRTICTKKFKNAPRFDGRKIAQIRKLYNSDLEATENRSDSVIKFCALTTDVVLSVAAGVIFALVMRNEHYDGMVQWIINNLLAPKEGAAWGDIFAGCALVLFGTAAGAAYFGARIVGEYHKAKKLVKTYVKELHVRPGFRETPDPLFMVKAIIWAIVDEIYEARRRKARRAMVRKARINRAASKAVR